METAFSSETSMNYALHDIKFENILEIHFIVRTTDPTYMKLDKSYTYELHTIRHSAAAWNSPSVQSIHKKTWPDKRNAVQRYQIGLLGIY
jgi:hypothetical protein